MNESNQNSQKNLGIPINSNTSGSAYPTNKNNNTNPYDNNNDSRNITVNETKFQNDEFNKNEISGIIRMGFIRKVYGIITFQLLITISLSSLSFFDIFRTFFLTNFWLFWTFFALNIVMIILIAFFRNLVRRVPINYIILTLWTICISYMVATICAKYEPSIVITAAVLTASVTVSLTAYVCWAKNDFSFIISFLCVLGMLVATFIVFIIFFPYLYSFYCFLGVLAYSFYLIFDTLVIFGSRIGDDYLEDDYIICSMMIYIDIIMIFIYLLGMLGGRK